MDLIDTGGTHTCIPSSSWDLFQDCGFILCPINGSATVADGGKVEITGIDKLTFTLGRQSVWTADVLLMKSLPFPLLIGMNTLEALQATLDFKNSLMSVTSSLGTEIINILYLNSNLNSPSTNSNKVRTNLLLFENGEEINLGEEKSNVVESKFKKWIHMDAKIQYQHLNFYILTIALNIHIR